jgi:hypothetical protein
MEENKKTNWLYVEFGSRGEKEIIEWREDKSFKEIEEICKDNYNEGVNEILRGGEDDEERNELFEYIEEFCCYSSKEEVGVEYMLNEECGIGFYNESIVKELRDVDLDKLNEEGWKMVENVIDRVNGICFEE